MIDFKSEDAVQMKKIDGEGDLFEAIDKHLISEVINAGDINKLQDALMMQTRKHLSGIKGFSEANVDKTCQAVKKLLHFWYLSGGDCHLKRKSVFHITTGRQPLDDLQGLLSASTEILGGDGPDKQLSCKNKAAGNELFISGRHSEAVILFTSVSIPLATICIHSCAVPHQALGQTDVIESCILARAFIKNYRNILGGKLDARRLPEEHLDNGQQSGSNSGHQSLQQSGLTSVLRGKLRWTVDSEDQVCKKHRRREYQKVEKRVLIYEKTWDATYSFGALSCLTFLKAWMIRLLTSCSGEMDVPLIVTDGIVPARGLCNYRNTCYINAVLQVIVHLDAKFLGSHAPGVKCTRPCAACLLYHFLIKYREGSSLNLEHLTRQISCFQHDFVCGQMDDCCSFWNAVVQRLPASSFQLSYCYKFTCRECEALKIGLDLDYAYSIPLVVGVNWNLFESLEIYISSSATDMKCDCGNSGMLQSLQLVTLPNVLAFQVGRYDDNRDKLNEPYTFPPLLDMTPYIEEDCFYTLHGVIVHKGETLHAGHYVCYVKSDNEWFSYSDDLVEPVEEDVVLTELAYMLVYLRAEIYEEQLTLGETVVR